MNLCSSQRDHQLFQSTSAESWIIHFLFTAGDRCVTSVMSALVSERRSDKGRKGGGKGSLGGTELEMRRTGCVCVWGGGFRVNCQFVRTGAWWGLELVLLFKLSHFFMLLLLIPWQEIKPLADFYPENTAVISCSVGFTAKPLMWNRLKWCAGCIIINITEYILKHWLF